MKKTVVSIFCFLLYTSMASAQVFGLFAENDLYKTGGDLSTDSRTPDGGFIVNGVMAEIVTGSQNVFEGEEALHVQTFGNGDSRLYFTYNVNDPEAQDNSAAFPEWNDANAFLVMHVKLVKAGDFNIGFWALRDGERQNESDESAVSHGLDTVNYIGEWQKLIIPINDPYGGGHLHDYAEWAAFTIRDRDNIADFYLDEVYVDYRPKITYGLYAEKDEFTLAGDLATDSLIPNGGYLDDGVIADPVTDEAKIFAGSEALQVQMLGLGESRLFFAANVNDPDASAGTTDFSEWNDLNAALVLHVKLKQECDFRVGIYGLRNGDRVEESDESMVLQGLDSTNLDEWQKILIPLSDGLEGNLYDYSKFGSFTLRDRDNLANFLVDEVYVIYPGEIEEDDETAVEEIRGAQTTLLSQNYPNPFYGRTNIEFTLHESAFTSLVVYDLLGQEVATLVNAPLNAGTHSVTFSGEDLVPGFYLYELRSGRYSQVKKMHLGEN